MLLWTGTSPGERIYHREMRVCTFFSAVDNVVIRASTFEFSCFQDPLLDFVFRVRLDLVCHPCNSLCLLPLMYECKPVAQRYLQKVHESLDGSRAFKIVFEACAFLWGEDSTARLYSAGIFLVVHSHGFDCS